MGKEEGGREEERERERENKKKRRNGIWMLQHAQSYNEPETVVEYGQDVEETAEHHDLGVEQPTYVRACVHAHACVCACVYACVYACAYACACVCVPTSPQWCT